MNKLKTASIVVAALLLFAGNVFAWSIDITPVYGDQDASDIVVNSGDQVMYQLWFNPDEGGTMLNTAYIWRLDFDESELEFDLDNSTYYEIGQPYQWWMAPLKEDPAGFVTAGATTFSDGTTLYEPFLFVDLAFVATNPLNDDLSDLTYDDTVNGNGDGFFIDYVKVSGTEVLNYHHLTDGADVAPVPIPGAIFLLVPAFLGLIGLRRKKA